MLGHFSQSLSICFKLHQGMSRESKLSQVAPRKLGILLMFYIDLHSSVDSDICSTRLYVTLYSIYEALCNMISMFCRSIYFPHIAIAYDLYLTYFLIKFQSHYNCKSKAKIKQEWVQNMSVCQNIHWARTWHYMQACLLCQSGISLCTKPVHPVSKCMQLWKRKNIISPRDTPPAWTDHLSTNIEAAGSENGRRT